MAFAATFFFAPVALSEIPTGMSIKEQQTIVIDGVKRKLSCDMNAGDILFDVFGTHWNIWMVEHFTGIPQKDDEGNVTRRLIDLRPSEIATVLYALLATDREDRQDAGCPIEESPKTLRRSITLATESETLLTLTHAVWASFAMPGKADEASVNAGGESRGSAPAITPGTGERP